MQMTPYEINQSYINAVSKSKQIGILKDLNACSRAEIVEVLNQFGHNIKQKVSVRRLRVWTVDMEERLKEYYAAGYDFEEIGKLLGVSKKSAMSKATNLYLHKTELLEKRQKNMHRI